MELALFCPVYGYYEAEKDTIGRKGDYFTSVSVGKLFGELLAFQFARWLENDKPLATDQTLMVEAGAHDGRLAADILMWLQKNRPALFERSRYVIAEQSDRRREWQQNTLRTFKGKVFWIRDMAELVPATHAIVPPPNSIIFSNELLDAFPVHRLGWEASTKSWFEWGVTIRGQEFVWQRMDTILAGLEQIPGRVGLTDELLSMLPDGFVLEVRPEAEHWWSNAAKALKRGRLITIDYGGTLEEMILPEKHQGTLRTYRAHRPGNDLLSDPGKQDITASVNFSEIQSAGEAAGLVTEVFVTQEMFLTSTVAEAMKTEKAFGEWTPERNRQFKTLTNPEHLGRKFRVLVQGTPDVVVGLVE